MCYYYKSKGKCTYPGCTFAHGQQELEQYRKVSYQAMKDLKEQSLPEQRTQSKFKVFDDERYYDEYEYYEEEEYPAQEPMNKKDPRYKTMMCHNMINKGECPYKKECTYAHSEKELRKTKPKFKG